MGNVLSQNSAPKKKEEGSSLIEITEIPEDDNSSETEGNPRIDDCLQSSTDPGAHRFIKTFQQLQGKKEQFHIQLHNEVIQWRLMYQRGVSNKFNHKTKVNILIKEFVKLHEQLDEFLEQERRTLERLLPKPKSFISPRSIKKNSAEEIVKEKARESLELTPEAMQRLVCFQRCNDQHILVLTQVLSDIEDCKTFVKEQPAEILVSPAPSPDLKPSYSLQASTSASSLKETSVVETGEPASNRPITITVSTDSEDNISSSQI